ncbi:dual specificity protein phosphatase family protein [Crenobacter sp. SG2305]|uniref:protein-tyrosine phosphatase family protein n=1 Tax=Crenobacter oryzisoli TaxID=3056844 RepID=UPI0025AA352F|nr:dual specificity protein phosphatase family protein [Crenobacter sp. SG2305]MDN0084955.1 dual specificity protein phosphatase family protein [Crenobacter sp. SG2305]
MSHEKTYHQLIADRIYLGGVSDVPAMVEQDGVQVIVDLREESTGCAAQSADVVWTRIPLDDRPEQDQSTLFKAAIDAVVTAYRDGKKVGFHCGGGKGRTGTVATGVLLELGLCQTLDEAEAKAKEIRPVLNMKPAQRAALERLYPQD